jgi:nitric oxide reductase activation protein
MARKSLRPHLNQIRAWVRQGRTDAWVAHQLEVSVRDIEQFKRQNELVSDGEPAEGASASDEVDLRAEDDALIAAELEAAEAEAERERAERGAQDGEGEDAGDGDQGDGEAPTPARRRSRRGGRRRGSARSGAGPLEGTFDHGEEGYGLWLDPAIQDNPVYAEHWAGHRPVEVLVEEDRIVIRRTSAGEDD